MKEKFLVEGMTCAACQAHVEKAVNKVKGVNECKVNLLTKSMEVDFDNELVKQHIINAVKNAGYKVVNKKINKDQSLIKLIVSFVFLLMLMYVSMSHMLSFPLPSFLCGYENALWFVLIQLYLTLPIIIIYFRYFISGYSKLFKLAPNMDSLISLGATASIIYGVVAIFLIIHGQNVNDLELVKKYYENLYFESAAMILTLVSLGKYFEEKSKNKTTEALTKLMNLAPKTAVVEINNEEKEVDIDQVKVDDIIVLKKGDNVPVDGMVIFGSGSINQANITGESMPVEKVINDNVFASTIVTSGYIKIKAIKVGEDTSIANIIKLVEEASSSKAPISKLVDRVSSVFVPIVLLISLITFAINILVHGNLELVFNFACSVLVVACPCALGLATPVAIMVGTGKGAECGLLIKNAEILEKSQFIKTIVLDKTGTITEGRPMVNEIIRFDDDIDQIAFSLEMLSEHPLANAINEYYKDKNIIQKEVVHFISIEGRGLKGEIEGVTYYAGNLTLIKELYLCNEELEKLYDKLSLENKTPLIFASEKKVLGIITVTDKLKETSIHSINQLQMLGIKVVMLTGDNNKVANVIAEKVNIKEVYSDVLPQEKQKVIDSLKQDKYHLVAMVGDGVNDALALTTSDLGISLGGGSDIAKESSDIVLLRNDLLDVKNVILLSKKVFKTIKFNLFWALFYNCIGILLATGMFYPYLTLNPMICSLMMSVSSVFVVLNSLTINGFKIERNEIKMKKVVLSIEGMMCKHCVKHVEDALKGVSGVNQVEVSLENKNAIVDCLENVEVSSLIEAVVQEGYSCKE